MKEHIPQSQEDIERIREKLASRKPDSDTKPPKIDGQLSKVQLTIPALLAIIGFIIGVTFTFANWMFSISGKLDGINTSIGYIRANSWTVNDQRNYSADLQIGNPTLKVPVVTKVVDVK